MHIPFFLLVTLALAACHVDIQMDDEAAAVDSVGVQTGAQQLAAEAFAPWQQQRVGLIVNHTALVGDKHLVDLAHEAPGVTVAAIFAPEHGWRGEADAGAKVEDDRDPTTGAPVYSIYGKVRAPTPEMLENVDLLVFDIQDVGARFYTYISTMGLSMQAAAKANIPFVVLDRPNPLGGEYVSGFVLEPEHESFVGQYPIPIAHGLTVGELAKMIKGEKMLDGLENLDLRVVEMTGYTRAMTWEETGLAFTPPSPNMPDIETARLYPGMCLFEGYSASEGRGTRSPFKMVGAPWADGEALAASLNAQNLPGIAFEAAAFTPVSIEGMSSSPKLQDTALEGVRAAVTDPRALHPVEAGVYATHAFLQQAPDKQAFFARPDFVAKLAGTDRFQQMLLDGATPEDVIAAWQPEVEAFKAQRMPYLLY